MISNNMSSLKSIHALVTGVNGFLGQALSQYLLRAGARVTGFDIHDSSPDSLKGIQYHKVNILDFDHLYTEMRQFSPEDVVAFHLAGQSNVGISRTEPLSTWSVNVTGTANMLEACRRVAINRIVFPSTALVYARPAPLPLVESDATLVNSVYESTKLASEALIKSYSVDFGFTCRIARLGNVYGPGGPADSVVQIVLRQVKSGGPITLQNLTAVRDFVYRDDVVTGLVAMALYTGEPGFEIFNLSSGVPTSIRELVETACHVEGLDTSIVETQPHHQGDNDKLVISIQRLIEKTGWHPVWNLEDGLRQTLAELGTKSK
jgi:nucleoside-diphosphate-sugar epimerase